MGITRVTMWVIGVTVLLTKSPDSPSSSNPLNHETNFMPQLCAHRDKD